MDINCRLCHSTFVLHEPDKKTELLFCPACGSSLTLEKDITFVQGHAPITEEIQSTVGHYQILQSIGKGGMGEVLLAYDPLMGRRIALKRIREDLLAHKQIHKRFLKEARITCQLTHPAIIPIYAIQSHLKQVFYTMPFVEGETLKQIFRESRKREQKGEKPHHLGSSIPALVRIFLTICQAVAYAHSKGVLHRDLKPENIIIGKYGETLILDWGLAKILRHQKNENDEELDFPEKANPHQLTLVGKVVGTVSYMAPERALGQPATTQTDIYALGVILYQILTLRLPFRRGTLKEFRQNMAQEELYDPIEIAPYREVPRSLSNVVLKCLSKDISQRYSSVDQLIYEIENYLEGRSEWFEVKELNVENKEDWEFQENVLIAEHIAITRGPEATDWVSLMISKESFPKNIKVEADIRIGEKGQGVGFLFNVPEAAERVHLNDGYCLWLGSDIVQTTKVLRAAVEVLNAPETFLQRDEWYRVRIEKIDNSIHYYLNDTLQFSYISHLPLAGTHFGLLSRDADFVISSIKISSGSQSVSVSCLAVPDAFLAHKDYLTALTEYRRIGYSFPGRTEGREAMFKAGVTLLEQAKNCKNKETMEQLLEQSLEEFGKMHHTPGAPLEYLGKALVYQYLKDYEEEIKCFELGYRRYPLHPLLPFLNEQVIYRMQESSRSNRYATYSFILLAIRYIPEIAHNTNAKKLFKNLKVHWEELYFIEDDHPFHPNESDKLLAFTLSLAFWVAKPYILVELIDKVQKEFKDKCDLQATLIGNALFSLIELEAEDLALEKIHELETLNNTPLSQPLNYQLVLFKLLLSYRTKPLKNLLKDLSTLFPAHLTKKEMRLLFYLFRTGIDQGEFKLVRTWIEKLATQFTVPEDALLRLDIYLIYSFMLEKKWDKAGEIFQRYPYELLTQESTPLHFLYGTWLYVTEGKEIAAVHFSAVLEVSYPRSWCLGSHYLNGKISDASKWMRKGFKWEKKQLARQLHFFYTCSGEPEKVLKFVPIPSVIQKDV